MPPDVLKHVEKALRSVGSHDDTNRTRTRIRICSRQCRSTPPSWSQPTGGRSSTRRWLERCRILGQPLGVERPRPQMAM